MEIVRYHTLYFDHKCWLAAADKEAQLEVHNSVELDNLDYQIEVVQETVVQVPDKGDVHTADWALELDKAVEVVCKADAVPLVVAEHRAADVLEDTMEHIDFEVQ